MGHSVREHTLKISPFQPLRSALSSLLDVLKTATLCCIFSQMIMVGTESESYTIPYCTVPPLPTCCKAETGVSYCVPEFCPNVGSCSDPLMLRPRVRLLWGVPSPMLQKRQLREGGSGGGATSARKKKSGIPSSATLAGKVRTPSPIRASPPGTAGQMGRGRRAGAFCRSPSPF